MRINSRSLRTSSRNRRSITGKAQIGATRHQPASDSIARIAGERKVAAGQILLHVLGVGGAGQRQDPDRLREANTTQARVALQRAAMPSISGCPRTSGLAVNSEKPW